MSRLISKKPFPGDAKDQKVNFAFPAKKKAAKPDVENAADAKKPGDAQEDGADQKNSKTKKSGKYFAKKAATLLASKK